MNKQDILNAFREMRRLNGYASIWKYHPMGVARDIDNWLLNALTEFEREITIQTIREVKDSIHEVYFSANPANSTLTEMDRVEIKANNVAVDHVVNILFKLEKEKHT